MAFATHHLQLLSLMANVSNANEFTSTILLFVSPE